MFNTIAHGATLFYHLQVIRHMASSNHSKFEDPRMALFTELQPKFFTVWTYAAQTTLFLLCLVHDLTRILSASNPLRRSTMYIRDTFFVALAMPMALSVSTVFWGMVSIDRELVFPKFLDPVLPPWLNHTLHTLISILVVVELFAEPHVVPSLRLTLSLILTVMIAYSSMLFYEYTRSGIWIYPVFEMLSWPGKVALALGIGVFTVGLAVAGRWLVRKVWGTTRMFPKQRKA